MAQALGDRQLEGYFQINLGVAYQASDRVAEAQACLRRALALGRELQAPALEGSARGQRGMLLRETGDTTSAIDQLRRCRDLCRQVGDREGLGKALYHLAVHSEK